MTCIVKLIWSNESNSWRTETEDVPGLALGSNSFDALVEKVRVAAPEMLKLNRDYTGDIKLLFEAERFEQVASYG